MTARLCRLRTRFGKCGRPAGHPVGVHAIPVGDMWFAWRPRPGRGSIAVGYISLAAVEAAS